MGLRSAWFDRNFAQLYHPRPMGQPRIFGVVAGGTLPVLALLAGTSMVGCRKEKLPEPPSQNVVRIVSITPAGTDLVSALGATDDLVGISTFDDDREGVAGKPRIGDYLAINWEKMAPLHPNILLLQYAANRVPPGIQQRCDELGIRIVNLKLDTIDEIMKGMEILGNEIHEPAKAKKAIADLKQRLDSIRAGVTGKPRVRTAIITSEQDFALAGPGEFLDEALKIAGGENVAAPLKKPYPAVDREMMLSLAPEVVIRLVPDGDRKPQIVAEGDQAWNSMVLLPAVRNHKVFVITAWYSQLPGYRVGDLAEQMADILHPDSRKPIDSRNTPATISSGTNQ
jgi:iron complex transport system substrate-binding protein